MVGAALGRVDRYELLELIGEGGFGGVYRARHIHTGQIVALKVARDGVDAEAANRILAEGRAAGRLAHPNVVGILDGGVAATGETFVVMELLHGMTLDGVSKQNGGRLDVVRAVDLAVQMLDGLAAAHARGVVHRDIKPSNVFVTASTSSAGAPCDLVKVIDFGISKLRAAGTTTRAPVGSAALRAVYTLPGTIMGTPGYMAPEQLGDARSVDARADVYSVGATLYELLSGTKPIPFEGLESWMRRLSTEPAPPLQSVAPLVPPHIAQAVDRALARDPDARWPSATALRDALMGTAASAVTAPPFVAPTVPMTRLMAPQHPQRPQYEPAPARSGGQGAWIFASIGIVVALLSIVALGLFVLLRSRL